MKMTPELKKAQENMSPGVITAEGFLGDDRRDLSSILDEDAQIMRRLGINPGEAAKTLRYLMKEGQRGLGEPVTVDAKWIVRTDEARGPLVCPWEDGLFRKINVTVERKDTGDKMYFTDLSIHLLEAHGFLEGRGSIFRLNLETMTRILMP